jgi:hypothetical protein
MATDIFTIDRNGISDCETFARNQQLRAGAPVRQAHSAQPGVEVNREEFRKASAAQRLLCAVGDWPQNQGCGSAVSLNARMMNFYGYKGFLLQYDESRSCYLVLHATAPAVVELRSIISYPDRKGTGREMLQSLRTLADDLRVTLWLDALPFGRDREHISLPKLTALYREFAFFRVRRIDRRWVNEYHLWGGDTFRNTMVRNPRAADMTTNV